MDLQTASFNGLDMDYFTYKNNELHVEDVSINTIVEHFGSPCYIYSRATLERHWKAFDEGLGAQPHLIS
jgi:diaminopimelate decarboxylase